MTGWRSMGRILLVAAVLAGAVSGQGAARVEGEVAERSAPVGIRARIEGVVLPGPALQVVPLEHGAPMVLRIVKTWPHGEAMRYDLEYMGLEPGSYDLTDLLQRADGTVPELPSVAVEVRSALPPGQVEPSPLAPDAPPSMGGYTLAMWAAGIVWVLGLLAILFVGRKKKAPGLAEVRAAPRTLADRLRPLVEAARRGELADDRKAELERLILAHWRERLGREGAGAEDLTARELLRRLRDHPEAGPLVQRLEEWLHRPGDAADVDVDALLAPYENVRAPGEGAGA